MQRQLAGHQSISRSDAAVPGAKAPGTARFDGADLRLRPSLALQHAFDLVAVEAQRGNRPLLVIANHTATADEIAARARPSAAHRQRRPSAFTLVRDEQLFAPEQNGLPGEALVRNVIWAMPDISRADAVCKRLSMYMPATSRLCIITTNALAQLNRTGLNYTRAASALHMYRLMRRHSFDVELTVGIQTPASIVLGHVAALLTRSGYLDLADRAHFAMRAQFAKPGWHALVAPVAVLIARRTLL